MVKKVVLGVLLGISLIACKGGAVVGQDQKEIIAVTIDLVEVVDDKVQVSIMAPEISAKQTVFYIPKIVPGTYSEDNYGELIDDFVALDNKGKRLEVSRLDKNSWKIKNANKLTKITYWVNDTYDIITGEKGVFSPAGTNIDKDNNFMLNLHAFVGYFEGEQELPYQLNIKRPKHLYGETSLPRLHERDSLGVITDTFMASRYFQVTDNPIMYAKPDTTSFNLQGMKVKLSMYSPNGLHKVTDIAPEIERFITAQKNFLGSIDNTNVYTILLYLTDVNKPDAQGYGALEHHTSTTVVLPETMPLSELNKSMRDVVSHEFFHIITPLNIHAEEIHYFGYNTPKMSKHLWMYEGVTEYFANLFQVNQGLISTQEFYDNMAEKIQTSRVYNDTIPFTTLSENVLKPPYKDDYYNVYQKGALIGMALDIRLRELSGGEKGILELMKQLSEKYGKDVPFKDEQLIDDMVNLTYPEIKTFFDTYVLGNTPIPYQEFLAKVGVSYTTNNKKTGVFLDGEIPFIDVKPASEELFFREGISYNSFLEQLGVKAGDVIQKVNGEKYDVNRIFLLVLRSQNWKDGQKISIEVLREGETKILEAPYQQPYIKQVKLKNEILPSSSKKVRLRKAWLKA